MNRLWALLVLCCACSELPDIPSDRCGNSVVEPGEDCDGFDRQGLRCIEPGAIGQCHMNCSPDADGARSACPDGYGCDAQSVCRKATGQFVALPDHIIGKAWSLARADFDGDGSDDVLSQEHPGTLGLSKARVHHFDRNAVPAQTWSSSRALSTPTPFVQRDDPHAHIAYLNGSGFGLSSGESDGSLIPQALPSYLVANPSVRVVSVSEGAIGGSAPLVALADIAAGPGIYHESTLDKRLELAVALSHGVDELASDPVVADLFEDDACLDLVLAFRNSRELSVYSLCEQTEPDGEVQWRAEPQVITLDLEPSARITGGLLAADFDGDGHLDLLVGSDDGSYLAYGDGGHIDTLRRHPLQRAGSDEQLELPIAAGDFSGDGIADLVTPHEVLVADASAGERALRYVQAQISVGAPWTAALIADFNRDGHADVVAVSAQGVDISFYNGTGSASLNPFTIPTDRPIDAVAVGDMDGDLINDLALVQHGVGSDTRDEVSIEFGNLSGAPGPVQRVARLAHVQQLVAARTSQESAVTNLALVFDQDVDGSAGSALALLAGSSDRSLPCMVELSTFHQDASLQSHLPLTLALGAFSARGSLDMLALAVALTGEDSLVDPDYGLWLVPGIDAPNGQSFPLSWDFPGDLQPLADLESSVRVAATLAAGDLDDDGIDELLLAAPDATGERCLLAVAHVDFDAQRVHAAAPLMLDGPCSTDTQLVVVDLDGDAARDLVMLHGTPDQSRRLLVLWGDGAGELSTDRLSQLLASDAQPRAFTLLQRTGLPAEIAYVNAHQARLVRARADGRRFDDAGVLDRLDDGTGIVAADVDGDTITDLCVADDGAVRVLHAALEPQ